MFVGQIINITVTDATDVAAPTDGNDAEAEDSIFGEGGVTTPEGGTGSGLAIAEEGPAEVLARLAASFNPGEEQGLLEFRIEPYPIPLRETTYIDFLFNLPEDLGDMVHVVGGEVVNTQPRHLHHFVLTGCANPVDPALEGRPVSREDIPDHCQIPVHGWGAGGDFYGGLAPDSGAAFGPGLGFRALMLNVHYTDGQARDPDTPHEGAHALATDGIRLLFTPDLRPRTVLFKSILEVGAGPRRMTVPPAEPR